MKKYKWILLFLNLAALLVYFNWSIIQKEKILKEGKLLFLELTPFNGKSMMQGDYMQLHYKVQDTLKKALWPFKGKILVQADSNAIIQQICIQDWSIPKKADQYAIEFSRNKSELHIGAEAYFIQEGDFTKYQNAKYAGLSVDGNGNSILVGLFNEHLQKIQ